MRIGLLAVDSDYPNIALMKISTYHKSIGDDVEWYNPLSHYDKAYFSKIFTFTPDYGYYVNADKVEKGGTGYNICKVLPEYIDKIYPDYGLYPSIDKNTAYGFLTRGCPNRCPWCIVPDKEGNIKPYMDVEEVAKDRKNLILMDNNILACDYGIEQINKIIKNKYRVDFNQGLDARLVTDDIAKLLSKVRWIKRIRFGCDTPGQVNDVKKAVSLLDKHGYKGEIFLYCIIRNLRETYDRIMAFQPNKRYVIQAQPYRPLTHEPWSIPQWQKDMAHWANRKELFKSCDFKDFYPRKNFRCKEYFNE